MSIGNNNITFMIARYDLWRLNGNIGFKYLIPDLRQVLFNCIIDHSSINMPHKLRIGITFEINFSGDWAHMNISVGIIPQKLFLLSMIVNGIYRATLLEKFL